jgi:hypothetical protein
MEEQHSNVLRVGVVLPLARIGSQDFSRTLIEVHCQPSSTLQDVFAVVLQSLRKQGLHAESNQVDDYEFAIVNAKQSMQVHRAAASCVLATHPVMMQAQKLYREADYRMSALPRVFARRKGTVGASTSPSRRAEDETTSVASSSLAKSKQPGESEGQQPREAEEGGRDDDGAAPRGRGATLPPPPAPNPAPAVGRSTTPTEAHADASLPLATFDPVAITTDRHSNNMPHISHKQDERRPVVTHGEEDDGSPLADGSMSATGPPRSGSPSRHPTAVASTTKPMASETQGGDFISLPRSIEELHAENIRRLRERRLLGEGGECLLSPASSSPYLVSAEALLDSSCLMMKKLRRDLPLRRHWLHCIPAERVPTRMKWLDAVQREKELLEKYTKDITGEGRQPSTHTGDGALNVSSLLEDNGGLPSRLQQSSAKELDAWIQQIERENRELQQQSAQQRSMAADAQLQKARLAQLQTELTQLRKEAEEHRSRESELISEIQDLRQKVEDTKPTATSAPSSVTQQPYPQSADSVFEVRASPLKGSGSAKGSAAPAHQRNTAGAAGGSPPSAARRHSPHHSPPSRIEMDDEEVQSLSLLSPSLREKVLSALARQPTFTAEVDAEGEPPHQRHPQEPSSTSRRLAADLSRYYDATVNSTTKTNDIHDEYLNHDRRRRGQNDDLSFPRFDASSSAPPHLRTSATTTSAEEDIDDLRARLLRQVQSARMSLQRQQQHQQQMADSPLRSMSSHHHHHHPPVASEGYSYYHPYHVVEQQPLPHDGRSSLPSVPRRREDLLSELRPAVTATHNHHNHVLQSHSPLYLKASSLPRSSSSSTSPLSKRPHELRFPARQPQQQQPSSANVSNLRFQVDYQILEARKEAVMHGILHDDDHDTHGQRGGDARSASSSSIAAREYAARAVPW